MKLGTAAVLLVLPACSWTAGSAPAERPRSVARAPAAAAPAAEAAIVAQAQPESQRRVGDVAVHRFSGEYRKTPLLFTERVVAREDETWVVDLTLEDGNVTRSLRVRFDLAGRPLAAARVEGAREVPVPIDEYHAFVEPTVFAAERNEGLLGVERATCLVGERELECETKNYRVRVAGRAGKLKVTESAALPGRDVGGEITTTDGRVVYRAELVELTREAISSTLAGR